MDSKNISKTLVEQGKNTLNSMKELNRRAKKKDKKRSDLYEKFRANQHSFRVYTYVDPEVGQLEEVKIFLDKLQVYAETFTGVDNVFETNVDGKQVDEIYEETITAYNEMTKKLGYEGERK